MTTIADSPHAPDTTPQTPQMPTAATPASLAGTFAANAALNLSLLALTAPPIERAQSFLGAVPYLLWYLACLFVLISSPCSRLRSLLGTRRPVSSLFADLAGFFSGYLLYKLLVPLVPQAVFTPAAWTVLAALACCSVALRASRLVLQVTNLDALAEAKVAGHDLSGFVLRYSVDGLRFSRGPQTVPDAPAGSARSLRPSPLLRLLLRLGRSPALLVLRYPRLTWLS